MPDTPPASPPVSPLAPPPAALPGTPPPQQTRVRQRRVQVGGGRDRPRKWVQVSSQKRCAMGSLWRRPAGGQLSLGASQHTAWLSVSALYSSFFKSAGLGISSHRWRSGVSRNVPLILPQSRSSSTRLFAVSLQRASCSRGILGIESIRRSTSASSQFS